LRLWDVASQQVVATLTGPAFVDSVAFSPDGKTVATGSDDTTVRLWDMASQQTIATLTCRDQFVRTIAFSPDGATLATGSDNTARLWHVPGR
jgi:WD40 repeat protein